MEQALRAEVRELEEEWGHAAVETAGAGLATKGAVKAVTKGAAVDQAKGVVKAKDRDRAVDAGPVGADDESLPAAIVSTVS